MLDILATFVCILCLGCNLMIKVSCDFVAMVVSCYGIGTTVLYHIVCTGSAVTLLTIICQP